MAWNKSIFYSTRKFPRYFASWEKNYLYVYTFYNPFVFRVHCDMAAANGACSSWSLLRWKWLSFHVRKLLNEVYDDVHLAIIKLWISKDQWHVHFVQSKSSKSKALTKNEKCLNECFIKKFTCTRVWDVVQYCLGKPFLVDLKWFIFWTLRNFFGYGNDDPRFKYPECKQERKC